MQNLLKEKVDKLALATLDGGAGKTALAFALAVDLNYYLISNDDSIIEKAYQGAKIMQNPILKSETVYDFGGFADAGVIEIIKECDIVIVPCINDKTSINKANRTIKELSAYNKKFLVVATRVENKKDLKDITDGVKKIHDIPILPMRKCKMFKDAQEYGVGVLTIENESKKLAYNYRNALVEYKDILKHILGTELATKLIEKKVNNVKK